jgi:hypothetical protein
MRLPLLLFALLLTPAFASADDQVLLAAFKVDATPPLGAPVAYAPARSIQDPLSARGIVLWTSRQKPIVLCAVDWIGIGNASHWYWKEMLAQAAGTTPERVAVHTLHQHDGVRCDFTAEEFLASIGAGGTRFDVAFSRDVVRRTGEAIGQSMKSPRQVTHLGSGMAKVDKVASNRRILGPDGKVKYVRYSACRIPAAVAAPEGLIDPYLRTISFYSGEQPLAVLTYYATHPQSYYGKGDVTAEFVGLGRAQREKEMPGVPLIHFNGASGNVAAGKYNDGSVAMRPVLTDRLAAGMRASWLATGKIELKAKDLDWRVVRVSLPVSDKLDAAKLRDQLHNPKSTTLEKFRAANDLAWLAYARRKQTECACLSLGTTRILHMPGELFVEYQLEAQKMRPQSFVCLAAYGDYGPGYICTEIAYSQGGYEPGVSLVAPSVEGVLRKVLRALLN